MADKKIKYSKELKQFLLELETLTDTELWNRWEEMFPNVLDWLWDQAYDARKQPEHGWQALRIQFLAKILRERGFDYPEQRAVIYYSRKLSITPSVLNARLYRRKLEEIEMPENMFRSWSTHFNQLVDQFEEEIWDYSVTELNFRDTAD